MVINMILKSEYRNRYEYLEHSTDADTNIDKSIVLHLTLRVNI